MIKKRLDPDERKRRMEAINKGTYNDATQPDAEHKAPTPIKTFNNVIEAEDVMPPDPRVEKREQIKLGFNNEAPINEEDLQPKYESVAHEEPSPKTEEQEIKQEPIPKPEPKKVLQEETYEAPVKQLEFKVPVKQLEFKVPEVQEEQEEIWEAMVPGWKKQYGRVYKSIIDGEVYIWRPIKRTEYKETNKVNPEIKELDARVFARQDNVTKTAVLYPPNIEDLIEIIGGLSTTLSEEILFRSGFNISSTEEL